jgi:3'(2'), 5'-bisphosphate nucleotidase
MTSVLDGLLDVAAEAARVIREVYETPFSVDYKGPADPVTAADLRANALICERLAQAYPGVPIVAEESDPSSFSGYASADRIFFVDPLDGTAEFVAKNGEFVVMIGVVEKDHAAYGVVCAPAQRTAWAGSTADGAFRVSEGGPRESIRVSDLRNVRQARAVSSRTHRSPALEDALSALAPGAIVMVGSAGLKGAEIAEGRADVYLGPGRVGKRWDACAIDAIITAAGGKFSDGRGRPFDYRAPNLSNEDGLAATNGWLHDAVVAALSRVGPPRP